VCVQRSERGILLVNTMCVHSILLLLSRGLKGITYAVYFSTLKMEAALSSETF
jgi:hypothetical protein